jgi:uncharacterized protein (TIGR02145 family)
MLYNWQAVDNSSGICPQGWHVPTHSEFGDLATELGSNAGAKLKETGTTHWTSESAGTSNSSGFTALPAGNRSSSTGTYADLGTYAYFWSSNYYSSSQAKFRYLIHSSSSIFSTVNNWKNYGFSVRCLKD